MTLRNGTARRPVVVARAAARKTSWFNQLYEATLTAAGSQQVFDLSHPRITTLTESTGTVVRMIMEVHLANAATVPDLTSFSLGVTVLTEDARAAGATPDPLSDSDQDWYYWWAGKPAVSDSGKVVIQVDIRSARRLRGGFRLAMIMQNAVNELPTEVVAMVRTLWMMP